jgi:hypothetical protein
MGALSLPSARSARSQTSPGRVSERQTLPLLSLGRRRSRRTQKACGTAMRSCASLFRGVAAPLGCVIFFCFCRNCGLYALRSGLSACARHGWYHYPQRTLRAAETPDGRLSKRLICRFLSQVGVVPRTIPIFLRIHRIFCWQFQLQTLLRYGTISSTNWNFQISLCKQPLNLHHQLQFPDGC